MSQEERAAEPESPPPEPVDLPLRDFVLEELRPYDGTNKMAEHGGQCPIYLAVNGTVFDVSRGKKFYGPGASLLHSL
jgi:membrane-associated progesterone receptor component